MKNKFPSLQSLKNSFPKLSPFYTQSWVYSGLSAYFGKQNCFDQLEFCNAESVPDFFIADYKGTFDSSTRYHGLVYEGHHDYWIKSPIPAGSVIITGHKHLVKTPEYISLGFDFWDINTYNEFRVAPLYYELNQNSVQDALYDVVIPVGTHRDHREKFMKLLNELKQELTIITDDRQYFLDTDLRFSSLGIEVYVNKTGSPKYQPHASFPSFYDTSGSRSLDHMPHKKMHSLARVNVSLETTVHSTDQPYLTEKTYKILAQRRPFVVFGDTNVLKKLREQGFLTFEKYCDESYDTILDPVARSQAVIEAIKQLVINCKKYPNEIDNICKHNKNLFFDQQRHADNLAVFGKNILDIIG
jgi:hypothetical protein